MSFSDQGRARRIALRGQVESRHQADALLRAPGDVVLVHRGRHRSLVIACPDGCGTYLTVNLDGRAGPAWRLYTEGDALTLYPSVWRDAGCQAHFILWRDRLIWCGRGEGHDGEPPVPGGLPARVHAALGQRPRSAEAIAEALGAIPWEVSRAADRLVWEGLAKASGSDPRLYAVSNAPSPREWIG